MSYNLKRTNSVFIRRKMLACRQRLGLTCNQVAELAHITRAYYIKIENGQAAPSRLTMMDIAKALKVERWDLLYELQSVADDK